MRRPEDRRPGNSGVIPAVPITKHIMLMAEVEAAAAAAAAAFRASVQVHQVLMRRERNRRRRRRAPLYADVPPRSCTVQVRHSRGWGGRLSWLHILQSPPTPSCMCSQRRTFSPDEMQLMWHIMKSRIISVMSPFFSFFLSFLSLSPPPSHSPASPLACLEKRAKNK